VVNTRYLPGDGDGAASLANFDHRLLSMGSIDSNVTTTLQIGLEHSSHRLPQIANSGPGTLEQAALQP